MMGKFWVFNAGFNVKTLQGAFVFNLYRIGYAGKMQRDYVNELYEENRNPNTG